MIKRLLTAFLALAFIGLNAQTRPGSLKGKVSDKKNGETIPFAIVLVKQGETVIANTQTDFDGAYNINPLNPGKYDVSVQFAGFAPYLSKGVIIEPDRPRILNVQMQEATEMLQEVVIEYEAPLIDGTKTAVTVSGEDMVNMATRSITGVAAQTAGVFQADEGQATFIRGARSNTTVYFIDGVKVRGSVNLPQAAIASTTVITGGLPAQYGDATGGVISTTTRGPSPEYFGSVEYLTSFPFDDYNYHLVGLTGGGPLWKREEVGANGRKSTQTIAGFLLAGEFQIQDDSRPLALDVYKVSDPVLDDLKRNPVRPAIAGIGVLNRTEFITEDDLVTQQARQNAQNWAVRVNGNVNFRTSETTNISVGGRYNRSEGTNTSFTQSLFNYDNFGEFKNQDWSTFVRFQQRFANSSPQEGDEESKSSLITNAFYSIQVDYTRNNRLSQDGRFGDNFFAYGHVGRFTTYQTPLYGYGEDTASGLVGWRQLLDQDTAVYFERSQYNPVLANYTSAYYDFLDAGTIQGSSSSRDNLLLGNALWNGFNPSSVYNGLWGNVGAVQSGYNQSQASQFRVTASSSFNIKDHEIILGFEYEQRIDRAYSLGAFGMWNQMFLMQNDHIQELDLGNPIPVYDEFGVFQDTINYPRIVNLGTQYTFDRNVRKALGLDPDGMDRLDIDSYDPEFFTLDMFSADELINLNGSQYVSYYGYDYKGNILSNRPSLNDFFTKRDANGDLTREIAPFEPIYISGYIQDQFSFDDLFFRVGVRVDRYDANQPVLKDPYVIYPTRSVGDLNGTVIGGKIASGEIIVPNTIGDDYVVYVNDLSNPTDIVGYRSGDNWFDASGAPESNPKRIADASTAGGIQPYLWEPDNQELSAESFVDYEPQINVMPRISFNFPISDEALFLAHYDVLVQRPDAGLARLDLLEYMRLQIQDNSGIFNNPNLLPQKTTEYELGFQQKLTDRSSLTISAFYREMRDMLQTVSLNEAYPITYVTYGNQDFGTVKGFTLAYELRRINNLSMRANYTLQFAQGSGSGPNSGVNIARSGQPNLRYILPLDYDSRHVIVMNFDYRYGRGKSYNGPVWWNTNVFAGAGLNLVVNTFSGTPYSRRVQAYPITAAANSVQLAGQVNGSRLPWQFRIDLRANKQFDIKYGKDRNKSLGMDVYVQIQNLLDTRNVLNVYPYTGSPDDDGYLTSAQAQNVIQSQVNSQSFVDLYNIRMANPFNFSLPRRIRLGMIVNF